MRDRPALALMLALGAACATKPGAGASDAAPSPSGSAAAPSSVDARDDGAAGRGGLVLGPALEAGSSSPSVTNATSANATSANPDDPYGAPRTVSRARCAGVGGRHLADADMRTSFVDGDDLLAIANRSPQGQLAPDFAPSDLVELRTGKEMSAAECDKTQCLRKEAASALAELMAEMKKRGFAGKVESAFRSYGNQCGTFLRWAAKGSFCDATEQSALPGHSQHQLGTTVDMFTEAWAKDDRGVFREGFGCTDAGKFLQEHASDHGFVMPYPIHPDDRHKKQSCVVRWDIPVFINPKSGYRFEHWHIRYVGRDAAARFKSALAASGPGTPNEITVEQWLRAEKGLAASQALGTVAPDAELPVCDGCNCGACATLAKPGESACDKKGGALHLDEHGRPRPAEGAPAIASTKRGSAKRWKGSLVEVRLEVPKGVLTQTPVVGPEGAGYGAGATYQKLAPYPETEPRAFAPIAGAWVVGVEPVPNDTGVAYPWRAAIAASVHGQIYGRANLLLPAREGASTVKIPVPAGASRVKVALLEGGVPKGDEQVVDLR